MNEHEFLWFSMRGMQWIPCTVIALNPCGEYYIRYFDDILESNVEATVDPDFIRAVKPASTEARGE